MNNQVKKWIRKCNLVTSRRRVLLHAVPGPEVLVRGAGLELLEVLDVLVRVGGLEALWGSLQAQVLIHVLAAVSWGGGAVMSGSQWNASLLRPPPPSSPSDPAQQSQRAP